MQFFTPLARALFCGLAALVLLWDAMLVCTALFFHIMIEKVVATCAAVLTWEGDGSSEEDKMHPISGRLHAGCGAWSRTIFCLH